MKVECPFNTSGLKLGLALSIVAVFILSPSVMTVNPALLAAAAPSSTGDGAVFAPSTISQLGSGDFTAQAPLSPPGTFLSTDIVSSKAFYEIVFVPVTTGTIKKVEMTFPAGTDISGANIIDRVGIGGGTLTKVGTTLSLNVQNAVSVPAGTYIRLEIVNVKNPLSPSSAYQVTVTTRDPANTPIDGPTQSTAYNVRRMGSNDIADGAITGTHPAESFMKYVILTDTEGGHARGWNPNGITTTFTITGEVISSTFSIYIFVNGASDTNHFCDVVRADSVFQILRVSCASAPPNGHSLSYVVVNLPSEIH